MTDPDPFAFQRPEVEHWYAAVRRQLIAVTHHRGPTLETVLSRDRSPSIVRFRQALYLALRRGTGWSYPEIGRALKRDHTTILAGCRVAEADGAIAAAVTAVVAKAAA